jgi:hypothetical protein
VSTSSFPKLFIISENNENSNEYTTEDELEIRDVSQRMSSVRIREQQREVREMPELR